MIIEDNPKEIRKSKPSANPDLATTSKQSEQSFENNIRPLNFEE